VVQKRCHGHRPKDLAGGVAGSQQGDGTRESEQTSGRQGHLADADEGGPEEDCTEKGRDRSWSHGGQRDAECLQK
jgi:hypothetical protein